jgi:Ni,Fe-hydrogenase III large subunit/Ni,Fe-hydrogenase III component G
MTTADPAATGEAVGEHRVAVTVRAPELVPAARSLLDHGYRVALLAGHDDGDALRVVYLFTQAGTDRRVELHLRCDPADPHLPSLAGLSFPAGRFEREVRDLFGIVPDDHPMPSRLVRHFHWPRGWHPMRRDAGDPPPFGDVDGPYPFRSVEGPGVYEIPVGPVHAGMIEPGHFRFSVVGETILNLKARLWFVHRGIEKLFEGRTPTDGIDLAERVSGDTSVGHALAFCRAVEDAQGLPIDPATQQIRAILLELERLYNHVTDIGALCNDVGHGILNNQAQRVKEQLLRINDDVTGHRLLRGAIRVGGASVIALPDPDRLAAIAADAAEIVALALAHSVVRDRFTGTAVLTRQQAVDLGALGYVARASGLSVDARRDHPTHGVSYPTPSHAHTDGDVLSRFLMRAEEITTSVETITHLMDHLDQASPPDAPPSQPALVHARSGVGIVEGWRGTIVHRVELNAAGTLTRVRIVDPSFFNWPALPVALADTIVPDFPLANKSFNLSYAGNDL